MDTRYNAPPPGGPRPYPQGEAPARRKKTALKKGPPKKHRSGASRKELESKLKKQRGGIRPGRSVRKPRRAGRPVVYTQPKAFSRNKFLLHVLIVVSVVLAFVLALSVFFRVEHILVAGANAYDEWEIREAADIKEGERLLSFSKARASGRIQAKLPYVDKVRIGIKLPDTVIIYVEELEVAYAAKCTDGIWWLITSSGRVVEQIDPDTATGYTQIKGIILDNPVVNQQAVAFEEIQPTTPTETLDPTAETLAPVVTVTANQKLEMAKVILTSLENNGIVGEAASVDVSNIHALELMYGTRYQVNLGDGNNMDYKIACMQKAIAQMSDYEMGVLDVSFTTWPDMVGFTPFMN